MQINYEKLTEDMKTAFFNGGASNESLALSLARVAVCTLKVHLTEAEIADLAAKDAA